MFKYLHAKNKKQNKLTFFNWEIGVFVHGVCVSECVDGQSETRKTNNTKRKIFGDSESVCVIHGRLFGFFSSFS